MTPPEERPLTGDRPAEDPFGIYIHVPFCAERCSYCAFDTQPGGVRELERYLSAVEADLRGWAAEVSSGGRNPVADTVFFGGGTPSLLPAESVARLLDACTSAFDLVDDAEVTLEMNPESCGGRVAGFLDAGVNRVSLGAQSFHDDVLRLVGRPHDAAGARGAVLRLRESGLENLNLDLIAGLPGSTVASFDADLDAVLSLRPEHVSVYLLETDKPTGLARAARRGEIRLPDEDDMALMFESASRRLAWGGFRHYEISNFARLGRESRHNRKYWTGAPVLGAGPSAWSHFRGRRTSRLRGLARYLGAMESGRSPVEEVVEMTPEAAAGEAVYMGLRLAEGVHLPSVSQRFGVDLIRRHRRALDRMRGDGLLDWDEHSGRVRLTPRGRVLANEVFVEFVA